MKKCSKCGKITDGMFCPNCGTDLRIVQDMILCPTCGNEINGNFCSNCGYGIKANSMECTIEEKLEPETEEMLKSINDGSSVDSIPEDIVSQSVTGDNKKVVYKKTWFIIVCLIIFFPVGLFLMWKYADWKKVIKIVVTVVIGILFLIGICALADESTEYENNNTYTTSEEYATDEEEDEADNEEDIVDMFTSESDYSAVDYDSLARTPDDYLLSKVKGTGEVIQVIEGDEETQLRISLDEHYDDVVLVFYDSDIIDERILEDDNVTYYGTSYGLYTYESTMGGDITVPLIQVHKIVRN